MPTYEYACKACGHLWEEIQKMSDPAVEVCEKCGEKRAQRLISQGNFILKGGGWYTTGGYGVPAKKQSEGDSSSSSDKSEPKKGDSKSESKPDTKSESKEGEAKSETKAETKPEPKADKPGSTSASGSGGSSSGPGSEAA